MCNVIGHYNHAVILSEVRRQPNEVEGPHVCRHHLGPRHFSTQLQANYAL
jgi:hypothetical protein